MDIENLTNNILCKLYNSRKLENDCKKYCHILQCIDNKIDGRTSWCGLECTNFIFYKGCGKEIDIDNWYFLEAYRNFKLYDVDLENCAYCEECHKELTKLKEEE